MKKKTIILEVAKSEETGKFYLYPDRYEYVENPELYKTAIWIEGKTARVLVISDEILTCDMARDFAICYMTGQFKRWTAPLNSNNPKWTRVK